LTLPFSSFLLLLDFDQIVGRISVNQLVIRIDPGKGRFLIHDHLKGSGFLRDPLFVQIQPLAGVLTAGVRGLSENVCGVAPALTVPSHFDGKATKQGTAGDLKSTQSGSLPLLLTRWHYEYWFASKIILLIRGGSNRHAENWHLYGQRKARFTKAFS